MTNYILKGPVRYFKLLLILLKFKLNKQMVYSVNFYMVFFADMALYIVQLLTFSAIFFPMLSQLTDGNSIK